MARKFTSMVNTRVSGGTIDTIGALAARAGVSEAVVVRFFLPTALPTDPGDLVDVVEQLRAHAEQELESEIDAAQSSRGNDRGGER